MKRLAILLVFQISILIISTVCQTGHKPDYFEKTFRKLEKRFSSDSLHTIIIVVIPEQKLYFIQDRDTIKTFSVSTSFYGTGNAAGSNKTPLGTHEVKYKYGSDAPLGTIFRSREPIGQIAEIYKDSTDSAEDLITTRILWLNGLEKGINKGKDIDSFNRYIYIHGTNEEGLIGRPSSHGCIRMKNSDVITLFEITPTGTIVEIVA